ncbi:MAG: type II toxin-antitoxin system PemK/MazF family toxin [Epsilonproteobacteria bacterium]|nr:type II toxin-antitoxin system PemK/MazF family toxin [Campylobacterota bacterium]
MRYSFGDIVLVKVPFVNNKEYKLRPAAVWFEEHSNVIIFGITSNLKMEGIFLPKKEGLIVDSIIKTNYIFTVDKSEIIKKITTLSEKYKQELCTIIKSKCKELK